MTSDPDAGLTAPRLILATSGFNDSKFALILKVEPKNTWDNFSGHTGN